MRDPCGVALRSYDVTNVNRDFCDEINRNRDPKQLQCGQSFGGVRYVFPSHFPVKDGASRSAPLARGRFQASLGV